MTDYEKAVALWRKRNITNDAELAEALNGHSIAFAYHSGKIENEKIACKKRIPCKWKFLKCWRINTFMRQNRH